MRDARRRLMVFLSAALFVFGAAAVFSYPAHHDLAWLLYVASELLHGSALYTGIVEVNPPLIIWLSILAEFLARVLGAWNLVVYRVLVLGAAAASVLLCRRQLRRFVHAPDPTAVDLLTLLLAYLLVAAVGFEFGQREHLAIALIFPFLLLTARQIESAGAIGVEDVAVGVMAGIGFAIKPHFVLACLTIELYVLLRRRCVVTSWPHIAVALVFALYGIAVVLFERDYFVLARLAAAAYARMSEAAPMALLRLPPALWSIAAVLLACLARPRDPFRELYLVLAAAAASFLMVVLIQGKGWSYHWIPPVTIAGVVLPLVVWSWLAPLLPRARLTGIGTVLAVAVALSLFMLAGRKFGDADAHKLRMQGKAYLLPRMIDVVERYANGGPIAALSTNMQAAFPLVSYTDVKWALRFNSLWLLPGVYPDYEPGSEVQYHGLEMMPAAERYMFDAVLVDLVRQQPTILIVDTLPPGYVLRGFDYLTYFGRDARFAALMRLYHEVAPVERYRIFVRE